HHIVLHSHISVVLLVLNTFPTRRTSDLGDPVRAAEAAGEEENPFGTAVNRRRRARRARAGAPAAQAHPGVPCPLEAEVDLYRQADRKSTRLNSSHVKISFAVLCWSRNRR